MSSSTPAAINVSDNITKCKSEMEDLKANATASEQEYFRVEGSLRVFASLKEIGIDSILVPSKKEEPIIDSNEVIDNKDAVSN